MRTFGMGGLLATLVAASFLLGASGCGSDDEGAAPTAPPPTTVKPPRPPSKGPPPPAEPPPAGDNFIIGIREKNPTPDITLACYIFTADGDVELRVMPRDDTVLGGDYSGDESSGRIMWADGGQTDYSWDGTRYLLSDPKDPQHRRPQPEGLRLKACRI
jgi:hypothetical protein